MKLREKYAIAAAVSLTLAAFGQGAAFEPAMKGEVSIDGKSTVRVEKRISRDLPIRRDMTAVKSFCFDMRISNPADFASYVCYFKSGGGWYKASFELPENPAPGGWYPITVTPRDTQTEGNPNGWR